MPPRRYRGRRRTGAAVYGGALGPPLTLPQATTLPATSLTPTSAFLNGAVNPEGLSGALYWFVYGTTPVFGTATPSQALGTAVPPVTVGTSLIGLTTGTTYYYAVVIQTAAGTVTGYPESFVPAAPSPSPTPSSIPSPTGTPLVAPHFRYPFTMTLDGAQVVEQDTLDEIFSCVRAIADCPEGACPEMPPGFGVPDPTFGSAPDSGVALAQAISLWEPRAIEEPFVQALGGDPDSGTWQIALSTSSGAGGGEL